MTDSEEHEIIRQAVWSGFHDAQDIEALIEDLLLDDPDLDPGELGRFARAQQQAKEQAQASWPPRTDCDRLDAAFSALAQERVLALHNAGYTRSDGHVEAGEVLDDAPEGAFDGYCFYHGQDVERAVDGDGLWIAFDHVEGDAGDRAGVARRVMTALTAAGLSPEWTGDVDRRIHIPVLDWKRRSPPA